MVISDESIAFSRRAAHKIFGELDIKSILTKEEALHFLQHQLVEVLQEIALQRGVRYPKKASRLEIANRIVKTVGFAENLEREVQEGEDGGDVLFTPLKEGEKVAKRDGEGGAKGVTVTVEVKTS